jgi:hypothetical protein
MCSVILLASSSLKIDKTVGDILSREAEFVRKSALKSAPKSAQKYLDRNGLKLLMERFEKFTFEGEGDNQGVVARMKKISLQFPRF